MARRYLSALLTLAVLAVAACSTAPEGMPDDFGGMIVYEQGSVPPQYHYRWVLELTGDRAAISWRPGYDEQVQPWTTTVDLGTDMRARLYERLRAAGAFGGIDDRDEGMVGGPTGSIALVAGGTTYHARTLGRNRESGRVLSAIHDAVTTVLPAQVWQEFERRQQEWGDQAAPR